MTEHIQLLRPQGRLDNATSAAFEREAFRLIDNGGRRLLVDLGGLSYISSAGIRVALAVSRHMKAVDGRLAFCSLNSGVAEVFELSGIDAVLEVYEDPARAAAELTAA